MGKLSKILWGIVLIAAGIIFALNAFNITDIDIFFDGWWTLFIIVPSLIGLFSERDKTGSIVGIVIGGILLLWCQDILELVTVWKLVIPAIIVIIGVKLLINAVCGGDRTRVEARLKAEGKTLANGFAFFSQNNMNFDGEIFNGAELNAIFGGAKCDLRNAVIEQDTVINATAIFGGIDILLPDNINIKTNSNSIFGGMSSKKHMNSSNNTVTVYVNGTCIFGGIDIK